MTTNQNTTGGATMERLVTPTPLPNDAVRFIEAGTAFMDLTGTVGTPAANKRIADAVDTPTVSEPPHERERFDVVVIGGAQAGLSVGYHLARRGIRFIILDAEKRTGDTWRRRWDSLRLFTAAKFDGLDGLRFPAAPNAFPTKDEMADYLEQYARHFNLPIRHGMRVDRLTREGDRYVIRAGATEFEASHVVVAMANYQKKSIPAFAHALDDGIVQLHSSDYRRPSQLQSGGVLIVGAGNSGAEIASELLRAGRTVWMSGRHPGHLPFRIDGWAAKAFLLRLLLRGVFHRVLTVRTPIGRKVRPKMLFRAGPLIRVKPKDLIAAGLERVPKTVGVKDGLPLLEDRRVLRAANVVWCTGFDPGRSWIDLPVFGDRQEPLHHEGVVTNEPGLYFVGPQFLYAMSSAMIHGMGRDAGRIAGVIASRIGRASVNVRQAR